MNHEPTTDARADDDAEDYVGSDRGPVGSFRQREAIGIVGETDRGADSGFLQIALEADARSGPPS